MNELQIFKNSEFGEVRTVTINNEPYFVGKDVADILGYVNSRDAISKHVDLEDKRDCVAICDAMGRPRNTVCINESGLYSLILSSKLPNAKQFKRWVTGEILPTIRKHGAYLTPETLERTIHDPDFIIGVIKGLKEEQEKRKAAEAQLEEQKPKVVFADAVSASHRSILVGELAKYLKQNGVDIGQNRLFKWLRENGYLCKNGNRKNLPTLRSMEMRLFDIKETAIPHADGHVTIHRTTKVTGKGQQYFINLFLDAV